MISVDVVTDNTKWEKKIKKKKIFFNKIVRLFPKKYNSKKKLFLTLLLSNNKNIKKLNYKFRKKK